MIKNKPNMNDEITYEEEMEALILGITTLHLYSMVDVQMIYFLLAFVIK